MQRILLVAVLLALGVSMGPAVVDGASAHREGIEFAQPAPLIVHGASVTQGHRVDEAARRFRANGLTIPPLTVIFHEDQGPCRDHLGLFLRSTDPWEVHVCSDSVEFVLEHELAHAWAAHNLTDAQRTAFMDVGSYKTWNDKSYPWNERGTEGAAVVIQQGISGLPLPPVLSGKVKNLHVTGYQILTGAPSPRYVTWLDAYGDAVRAPASAQAGRASGAST